MNPLPVASHLPATGGGARLKKFHSAKRKANLTFHWMCVIVVALSLAGFSTVARCQEELEAAAGDFTGADVFEAPPTVSASESESLDSLDATLTPTATSAARELTEEKEDRLASSLSSQPFDYHANMPVITKRELANAVKQAKSQVEHLRETAEPEMSSAQVGTRGWLANSMFHKAAMESRVLNQTDQALAIEEVTRLLAKQFRLSMAQVLRGLPLISVDSTALGRSCPRPSRSFNCVPGLYRSLSGHCNNVQNADWGSAETALLRYAPARYSDHVSRPPRSAKTPLISSSSSSQSLLPSSRQVSSAIYLAAATTEDDLAAPASNQHAHMTTTMSFFGQFLIHDLVLVSQYAGRGGNDEQLSSFRCCQVAPSAQHPECLPVEFREGGRDFCLDYVRSTPAVRAGCSLGARDQLNSASAYIDGSGVYGASEEQSRRLRAFVGGRLRSHRAPNVNAHNSGGHVELLPQIGDLLAASSGNLTSATDGQIGADGELDASWIAAADACRHMATMRQRRAQTMTSESAAAKCFQAGDVRVNDNIGLTLMHTIWMREHNKIADGLAKVNKHWGDERLFEESRRIVVAELQHITYSEFLPSILGAAVMREFNLTTQTQGYSQAYDPTLNAAVSNEVATAVFPFILSSIPATLERYSERLEVLGATKLADTFMDASELLRRNRFAQYLTGMLSQSAMEPVLGVMHLTQQQQQQQRPLHSATSTAESPSLSTRSRRSAATTDKETREPPEIDLVALTIQQGRDHGLRGYLFWRQACQLRPQVRTWQDLKQVMPAGAVHRLQQVYSTPQQLDLYLALLEHPLPGASLGPTFVCLLARQFHSLKHGDRYWYENDLPGAAFTPSQLDQIRQMSLAKIMCANSQSSISFIQPSPMLTSDPYLNAYQYCTNRAMLDGLDLSRWAEPVTSAGASELQLLLSTNGLEPYEPSAESLLRGRRFAEQHASLLRRSVRSAGRRLDQLADEEADRLRRHRRSTLSSESLAHAHSARAYRYLPRPKRQTLRINNQSLIFELATNEVVRSLLHRGKDRERAQSVQNDIRDFLHSLESAQLDNLLVNSGESERLNEFIAASNGNFLTAEQRGRFAANQLGQPTTAIGVGGKRTTQVNELACQDDERAFPCDHTTQFRSATGWCNNLEHPKFGQSFTVHDRLLANAYEDGLALPRRFSVVATTTGGGDSVAFRPPATTGASASAFRWPLPSARQVSTTMHDARSQPHLRYSLALMQFGQFGVDHDLVRTPFAVALDGSLLDCARCDSRQSVHRECLPIEIPADDPFFRPPASSSRQQQQVNSNKCLHFVRSLNGQTGVGPRQQLNALTSYLDASNVYGSDNCEAASLRAFVGGRLNSSAHPADTRLREILPVTRANPECATPSGLCFHAGDQRASEQPGLTSMHTVFLRLHNSVVAQLAAINKHWGDEKLYQHGRRIVAAVAQRITFGEFAPRLLGLDLVSRFDLLLKNVGYSDHYDPTCSASVLTEFAAAAFRMGHSLIRPAFPLLDRQYRPVGKSFQLRHAFFNSQRILSEPNLIDNILRGVVSTPIETLDNAVTDELTNHLFERPNVPFSGMDLVSLNIQRARDHGVAGYNNYRARCNLTRAKTFEDLSAEIPAHLLTKLARLYRSVDDIDLFTGGMSELPVHGGIIGPTLGCIIGIQFARLKRCDRFWHETSDRWVRFSASQLAEIRKVTLARVICQESDGIDSIQRNAMDVSDNYLNPRVACASLPAMDLSAWRENLKSCQVDRTKFDLGQTRRLNPCKSCTCTAEGPVCRTVKVNCLRAVKQPAVLAAVMADKSCLVQCAWALDMQSLA